MTEKGEIPHNDSAYESMTEARDTGQNIIENYDKDRPVFVEVSRKK